jgi:hypothetical protein
MVDDSASTGTLYGGERGEHRSTRAYVVDDAASNGILAPMWMMRRGSLTWPNL